MPSLNTKLASAPNTQTNYVLKATSSTTIGNSLIQDNGTTITLGGALSGTSATFSSQLTASTSRVNGRLFTTSDASFGDMLSTTGVLAISYDAAGQTGYITSRNYTTSTNTPLVFTSSAATFSSSVTAASGLYNGYTSGLPPTSGSATRGGLRLNNASNIAFDFGTVAAGQAWIQVSDANNYASNFALLLNPNGGNVGIGTTTMNGIFNVKSSSASTMMTLDWGGSTYGYYVQSYGGGVYDRLSYIGSDHIWWTSGPTERMRITSGGEVLIGGTTTQGAGLTVYNPNAGGSGAEIRCTANTGNSVVIYSRMSVVGSASNYLFAGQDSQQDKIYVYGNGNIVNRNGSYGTLSSDVNLKQDIVDANSQWNDIKNLRVVNFRYIEDVEREGNSALRQIGFIAQEVEQVSPSLVYETKSPESEDTWKSIKTSIIHLKAVKALQEAMERIEQLEAKVTALENK